MQSRIIGFARQNWPVVALLALSLGVGLWFAGQVLLDVVYFNDPAHQDASLRGWMTPRYVVMSYDLPRGLVAEVLGLRDLSEKGIRLEELAAQQNTTLDELTARVRAAADAYRTGAQ